MLLIHYNCQNIKNGDFEIKVFLKLEKLKINKSIKNCGNIKIGDF